MKKRPQLLIFGAIVVLTMLVGVLVLRHRQAVGATKRPPDTEDVAMPTQAATPPLPAGTAQGLRAISNSSRLAALERSVAELQAKPVSAGPTDRPPPNPDEDFRKNQEEFAAAIAKHRSEPVDEAWSRRTAASLQGTLEQIASNGQFALLDVDCRKESCVATVEWESYGRAIATYGNIVTHSYDVPCGTGMILPVPSEPAARYRADAIFTCHSQ